MSQLCGAISPGELKKTLDSGDNIKLIDVRNFDEYKLKRLPACSLIPLPELDLRCEEVGKNDTVCLICKSGKRSQQAYQTLQGRGLNVAYLEGGLEAWQKAGYPLIEAPDKSSLSIDEQTRIAIGVLVLLGLLVPFLHWLPWVVGIMLIYAGISGNCMMMNVLASMPWNK